MSKITRSLAWMVIVGLILAVGSVATLRSDPSLPAAGIALFDLLERLGDALVIAAIVGGVIEKTILKKDLQKDLLEQARNFFINYFGRLLPKELQRRLRSYLEISLVRTSWDITYTIQHWEGHRGHLKLETVMDYVMENRSEEIQPYEFLYEVEDSLCPEISQTAITSVRVNTDNYDADRLKDLVTAARGYQIFKPAAPVSMEPSTGSRHSSYSFHAESVECFKDGIVSPFWALYPVMKTKFTIWYPDDVEVLFDVTLGDVDKVTKKEAVAEGDKKGTRWIINEPILPGQGFHLRCNLKPLAQSGPAPKAPSALPNMVS
jgi:hypothetical protein